MNDDSRPSSFRLWMRVLISLLGCAAVLAGAAYAVRRIQETEPTAEVINATRKSAALVETLQVRRASYRPQLVVLGTVEAAQDITLSPRIRGQVIELAEQFTPGALVSAKTSLLKIDPSDFENTVSIRRSELEQAEASLEIEKGRQSLAEKELALLETSIDDTNRGLVLREPQIASIRAEISAANAALERAQLDLSRTEITAPFDAQILSRSVNIGSQVGPGDELARLVGIEEYWLMAAVPVSSLPWIEFEQTEGSGSPVTITDPGGWESGVFRSGTVSRMLGSLDRQTRLARVLISVPDPLGRESASARPLILQSLLEAEIQGRPIPDVVRLERKYVRDQDTVWVMQDGELQIRDVDVVFRDADYAYIGSGLNDGDEVVRTTLATVANGIRLRRMSDPADTDEEAEADKERESLSSDTAVSAEETPAGSAGSAEAKP